MHSEQQDVTPANFWGERYAGSDGVWSGRLNRTVVAETRTRPATGPDGEQATLDDAVLLRRELPASRPA